MIHRNEEKQIKLVKILQEMAELKPEAYHKHQRERWRNIS